MGFETDLHLSSWLKTHTEKSRGEDPKKQIIAALELKAMRNLIIGPKGISGMQVKWKNSKHRITEA